MLLDTLHIPTAIPPNAETGVVGLTTTDTDNGRRVREYIADNGDVFALSTSRIETKENAPVGSRRLQIRLERRKVLDTGMERVLHCSIIVSSPRNDDFTQTEVLTMVSALVNLLCGRTSQDGICLAEPLPGWAATTESGAEFVKKLLTGSL